MFFWVKQDINYFEEIKSMTRFHESGLFTSRVGFRCEAQGMQLLKYYGVGIIYE